MLGELTARFLLGGAIVSAFSVLGQTLRPPTFAGLFGAAPSVALVSLGFALLSGGPREANLLSRSMLLGAIALVVYCAICVQLTRRRHPNLWLDTALAWAAWLGPALGLWWLCARGPG